MVIHALDESIGVIDNHIGGNAEFNLLSDLISEMVQKGELPSEYFDILNKRLEDKTIAEIAKKKGCSRQNIEKKLSFF